MKMLRQTVLAAALAAGGGCAVAQDADTPADTPADPMAATPFSGERLTEGLGVVNVLSADFERSRAFLQGAMGLSFEPQELRGREAERVREAFGLPGEGPLRAGVFHQPAVEGETFVRVFEGPGDLPPLRPGMDSRFTGTLGYGFPMADIERRIAISELWGFPTVAGLQRMQFPRADGSLYWVGETHFEGPDDVLVLGVDRYENNAIGPVDPALGLGGVAYSSFLVDDLARNESFFADVLGLEKRRDITFNSSGDGGMVNMRKGEEVVFQQWFAPGASSNYLVLMQFVDDPEARRPSGVSGFEGHGVGGWSFETEDLNRVAEAWREWSGKAAPDTVELDLPEVGRVRSLVLRSPDGIVVDVFERVQ